MELLLILSVALNAALLVLRFVAPRTENTVDDAAAEVVEDLRDAVDGKLEKK